MSPAAEACIDLADYIERSGAASSRFLKHVAGFLRDIRGDHPMRRQQRGDDLVDRIAEMVIVILLGNAKPLELRAFAAELEATC